MKNKQEKMVLCRITYFSCDEVGLRWNNGDIGVSEIFKYLNTAINS